MVRPRLRYAAISFLIATAPILLMALASRTPERDGFVEPLRNVLVFGAAQWYPWAILAPFIDRQVRRWRPEASRLWQEPFSFPPRAKPASIARHSAHFRQTARYWRMRTAQVAAHVGLLALFVVAHALVLYAATSIVAPEERRPLGSMIAGEIVPDIVLYGALATAFGIAEARRRHTEVAERLRAEVAEARLDALRQQLNPHFLFNTLNHIAAELRSGEVKPALRMLLSLADLLRDVLRERAQLIPLRDEVHMLERYLEIERERFGDRLQVEVTLEPRALDALVPCLLLQPLVENAVRHGISAADGRCQLTLAVRAPADRVTIEVRDAGPGLAGDVTPARTGVGLSNTEQRLKYLFGDDYSLELRPVASGGLVVSLELPFKRS